METHVGTEIVRAGCLSFLSKTDECNRLRNNQSSSRLINQSKQFLKEKLQIFNNICVAQIDTETRCLHRLAVESLHKQEINKIHFQFSRLFICFFRIQPRINNLITPAENRLCFSLNRFAGFCEDNDVFV